MNKELIEEIIEYIKDTEIASEWEWGACRTMEELIEQEAMPETYYKLLALLEGTK